MFCQYIFITKTLSIILAKPFFVFVFCFEEHKSVKVFNVHIMWFIIINEKQQIHWVFKFLISKVNWKNTPIFITKHINTNIFHDTIKNTFDLCFWRWLVLFLDFLVQQVGLCKNFLITVDKSKCWCIETRLIQ